MHLELAQTMAAYNRWMNGRLYATCSELTDEERKADRGAFFGSIHGTLNHLLLGDKVWLGRFTGKPFQPASLDQELFSDFDELRAARETLDAAIEEWATNLNEDRLKGKLVFTSIVYPGQQTYDLWVCVAHFFNHQTHHRGQLTALLSQAGKDYGVTDLMWLPGVRPE